ncbi:MULTISPECIES: class I SAM-dependent methyltransferase [unclassified Streptomyces]|uniref:class I SAM-dependent methyltransferase n=1 Tax=unclassified Streptomyces TaxID=2593676 RepID=UPI0023664A7B|nr:MULTISPECIES: class I SAM-dependent methyltransferase [unclassified Streptomyces]MDF3142467.1 class I SAM-dependent methyltransferase [Streptomyces sp. T21Q-yed]WDF39986.1 class I SAM-dependent methyltransferase [Streptomyces sp. T12]
MSSLDIVEAERLEASNLFYRDPALYDDVQSASDSASICRELIYRHCPEARTLLDFGCGTGRDLELLARRFDCVGVDLQPGLVDYARRTRPGLDVRVGDMRSVRLGHTADVLVCLGNSLAYVHDNADVRAAFQTFAAHAHPDTLLVLCSPVAPIESRSSQQARVDTRLGAATVTISYEWDLRTQINTMRRHWVFDSGEECHDAIRRRVLGPRELELHALLAGFEVFEIVNEAGALPVLGPGAYTVARYQG